MSVSRTVSEIFSVKEWRDLENGGRIVQGHWKWRRFIDHTTFCWSAIVSRPIALHVLYHFRVIRRLIIVTLKSEGHPNSYHSNLVSYPPSIVFVALSCIVSEIKRDISWKSWFFIPPCIWRPRYEGPRRNIAIPFGMEKLELWGYPMVKKIEGYL